MTEIRNEDVYVDYKPSNPWLHKCIATADFTCPGVRIHHVPSGVSVFICESRVTKHNEAVALARLAEILSVEIVERVERETVEGICNFLFDRTQPPTPSQVEWYVMHWAKKIRDGEWKK